MAGAGRLRFGRPSGLTPTTLMDEISERGITWNLSALSRVGQFAADDYFAINAEVASTDPPSIQFDGTYSNDESYTDRWVHGLQIEPLRHKASTAFRRRLRSPVRLPSSRTITPSTRTPRSRVRSAACIRW
jgi:hypothetical protein